MLENGKDPPRRSLSDLAEGNWEPLDSISATGTAIVHGLATEAITTGLDAQRPAGVFFVPGRIEVLGKHTDYAGGRSLVAATEQGIWSLVCPRPDSLVRVIDTGRQKTTEFKAETGLRSEAHDWTVFPRTVTRRLIEILERDLRGADIFFVSQLPAAAGMSSSSALIVSIFLALSHCNRLSEDQGWRSLIGSQEDLAAFLGAVENGRGFGPTEPGEGVGTRGGNQDQTAILCSGRSEISQYRFLPTVCERRVGVPAGQVFAIAVSGVAAKKTGGALQDYNRLSDLVVRLEEALNTWQKSHGKTLGELVRGDSSRFEDCNRALQKLFVDEDARRDLSLRLRQFWVETEEIIPAAGNALAGSDLTEFGSCVVRSMRLATEILGNQIDETIWLASQARDFGAVAASAFGAGFGGAVWAMVPEPQVQKFLEEWSADYARRFPELGSRSSFFWTAAGRSASEL